ncbi:MAG: ABC transporter permease [Bacillota bacterium]
MIADIGTVMSKELKEMLVFGGGKGRLGLLVLAGVFGVFLPLQVGRAWVESPAGLIYWIWVPLFLVTSVIADSFAGERERHTLETLVASRLSARAILFGKVGAAISYGWGLTLVSMFLGLITVNVAHRGAGLILYSAAAGFGAIVLSLLGAGMVAGAGVLVSLRASTVRQAQQTLSIGIMLLIFIPVFGLQSLPAEWKAYLAQTAASADLTRVVLTAAAFLAVLDYILLSAALARFRRERLAAG